MYNIGNCNIDIHIELEDHSMKQTIDMIASDFPLNRFYYQVPLIHCCMHTRECSVFGCVQHSLEAYNTANAYFNKDD